MADKYITSLSKRVVGSGQTVNYVEQLDVDYRLRKGGKAHKIRIRLRADSCGSQSYGIAERWNGDAWAEVASLSCDEMIVDNKLGYDRDAAKKKTAFDADRNALLKLVDEVLG